MGVPLLPVWKLPAHPRRIPWSTTGGFLASPPRAHASPRAGSPLVPGAENRCRLAVGADESAYLFRAPSTSPRRNGPESACRRFQGPRPSLEEILTRPQPVRGLSEFLLDFLQLLKKAEAVAQSRALLRAILMPDAIIDRRRPGNGKTSEFGARLGGRSCADRCGITSPRGSLAAWSARWLWPGTRHPHRSRRWCWGNRWPGS